MNDSNYQQDLKRLEFKVNVLLGFGVVQMLMLALVITATAISEMTFYMAVMLIFLLVGIFGYIFRQQVPGWFGKLSRMIFAYFLDQQTKSGKK